MIRKRLLKALLKTIHVTCKDLMKDPSDIKTIKCIPYSGEKKEKKKKDKTETKSEEKKKKQQKTSLETLSMNLILTREVARDHHNPGKTEWLRGRKSLKKENKFEKKRRHETSAAVLRDWYLSPLVLHLS